MDEWLLTPGEWLAVGLSLKVAVTATLVSLPFGISLGYVLARRQFRGKSLVDAAISLPLVLPPVVTGYLLLVLLGRRGWIGSHLDHWFGLQLVFTWKAAAMASAVMAFPLMVRAIRLAFIEVDQPWKWQRERSARGRWKPSFAFRCRSPGAESSLGPFSLLPAASGNSAHTVMIAGNLPGETQTIPLLIYSQANSPGGIEATARLVVVCIVIAAAALGFSEYLERSWTTR